MSPWRRLVPLGLCLGMALLPLLALHSGSSGAGATVAVTAGDPLAGRPALDRASRSAPQRSFDVALDAASTAGAPAAAPAVVTSSPPPTAGAAIASAAPARRVVARSAVVTTSPRRRTAAPVAKVVPPPPPRPSETGDASWYGAPAGTCAHPWLAIGTLVTVTNLATGRSTTCRVADRGPFAGGRVIDLSKASFAQIASLSSGVIDVRLTW